MCGINIPKLSNSKHLTAALQYVLWHSLCSDTCEDVHIRLCLHPIELYKICSTDNVIGKAMFEPIHLDEVLYYKVHRYKPY